MICLDTNTLLFKFETRDIHLTNDFIEFYLAHGQLEKQGLDPSLVGAEE